MRKPGRAAVAVALFLFALYLWSFKGTSHSTDEWFFIDQMGALLQGRFDSVDAQYLGLYLLAMPLMLLSRAVDTFGAYQILCLFNAFTTAAAAGLIVLLLSELGYQLEVAGTTALVYGMGTMAWPYSGYFLREPAAAMWLLAAALFIVKYRSTGGWRWWVASMSALAVAILTKRTVAILVVPWLGYVVGGLCCTQRPQIIWRVWRSWSTARRVLVGVCAGACALAGLGAMAALYGLLPSDPREAVPDLQVLVALLVSPGWGLFLFSPVLLLAIPGIVGLFRRHFLEAAFLWGMAVLYVLAITNHPLWWGTWNWGPRQVNPVLPLLMLPMAETLRAWGSSGRFRLVLGALLLASTLLAAMQAFVSYPFLQVAFEGGIGETAFIWNWSTSPVLTHWNFITLASAEPVWARIDAGGSLLFLAMACLVGMAAWMLLKADSRSELRSRAWVIGVVLLQAGLAAVTLHLAYASADYGGQVGFSEAATQLRRENRPGDALVEYLWGEPLWAYTPRLALLNYCKGGCPPPTVIIKEQVVDNNADWPAPLYNGVRNAVRAWVVMQGLTESDPRPVEAALAREWFYAGATWTGPAVRLVRFELPSQPGAARVERRGDALGAWTLRQYAVQMGLSAAHNQTCAYVTLAWGQEASLSPQELNTSLQFLDPAGRLVSQLDFPILLLLHRGQDLLETRSLLCLPAGASPGSYQLVMAVYKPDGGERLRFSDGETLLRLSTWSDPAR